jgi:hypothetical protein
MIDEWSKLLVAGESFKGLRDLVRAFESACHLDDMVTSSHTARLRTLSDFLVPIQTSAWALLTFLIYSLLPAAAS